MCCHVIISSYICVIIIKQIETMTLLINRISELENKQDNGTITMDECSLLNRLIERVESFLFE